MRIPAVIRCEARGPLAIPLRATNIIAATVLGPNAATVAAEIDRDRREPLKPSPEPGAGKDNCALKRNGAADGVPNIAGAAGTTACGIRTGQRPVCGRGRRPGKHFPLCAPPLLLTRALCYDICQGDSFTDGRRVSRPGRASVYQGSNFSCPVPNDILNTISWPRCPRTSAHESIRSWN